VTFARAIRSSSALGLATGAAVGGIVRVTPGDASDGRSLALDGVSFRQTTKPRATIAPTATAELSRKRLLGIMETNASQRISTAAIKAAIDLSGSCFKQNCYSGKIDAARIYSAPSWLPLGSMTERMLTPLAASRLLIRCVFI
jgi:hypothetical protein